MDKELLDEFYVFVQRKRSKAIRNVSEDFIERFMGLSTEANEVLALLQKAIRHNQAYEENEMLDELSDVFHYFIAILASLKIDLEDVIKHNMEKLKDKYN